MNEYFKMKYSLTDRYLYVYALVVKKNNFMYFQLIRYLTARWFFSVVLRAIFL